MTVKSLSEAVELSTAHARKQFEAVTAQTKELTALAQKVATETAEPIKDRHDQGVQEGRLTGSRSAPVVPSVLRVEVAKPGPVARAFALWNALPASGCDQAVAASAGLAKADAPRFRPLDGSPSPSAPVQL